MDLPGRLLNRAVIAAIRRLREQVPRRTPIIVGGTGGAYTLHLLGRSVPSDALTIPTEIEVRETFAGGEKTYHIVNLLPVSREGSRFTIG